jgi:hypothetical protein
LILLAVLLFAALLEPLLGSIVEALVEDETPTETLLALAMIPKPSEFFRYYLNERFRLIDCIEVLVPLRIELLSKAR